MDGLGIVNHEGIGAAFLAQLGFAPAMCRLVGSHVEAKRYLACRKAGYLARLSDASRGTLAFQGGPMSEAEAARLKPIRCLPPRSVCAGETPPPRSRIAPRTRLSSTPG